VSQSWCLRADPATIGEMPVLARSVFLGRGQADRFDECVSIGREDAELNLSLHPATTEDPRPPQFQTA
jgi:hypothetical protein